MAQNTNQLDEKENLALLELNRTVDSVSNNLDGDKFQDAVQFFKDPSSFQFLENVKTSDHTGTISSRDSLYKAFDPLHEKSTSVQNDVPISFEESASSYTLDAHANNDEVVSDVPKNSLPVENKSPTNIAQRESFGSILLSFDSPTKSNFTRNSCETVVNCPISDAPNLYTEEELQQAVKINELSTQEVYLKKHLEMEEVLKKGIQEKDRQIIKLRQADLFRPNSVAGFTTLSSLLFQKNEVLSENVELESEKQKLCKDLETSSEDLQRVEHIFADLRKRYEQCKGMSITYKDNEESLVLVLKSLNNKLEEQKQMYNLLQERVEEIVEKASAAVANVKKDSNAQIAILEAKLKRFELKISSLKSDLRQVQIEKNKLSGMCDNLMSKVSES